MAKSAVHEPFCSAIDAAARNSTSPGTVNRAYQCYVEGAPQSGRPSPCYWGPHTNSVCAAMVPGGYPFCLGNQLYGLMVNAGAAAYEKSGTFTIADASALATESVTAAKSTHSIPTLPYTEYVEVRAIQASCCVYLAARASRAWTTPRCLS